MTTPRWNRPQPAEQPYQGASKLDYAGFAFCTVVVIWALVAWAGWIAMRPAWIVLLVTLSIGLGVGARSRPVSTDRWHADHARLAPFVWVGRGIAIAVLLAACALTWLSIAGGAIFGTDHVILLAKAIGYAALAVRFAPLAADPNWKATL